MNLGVGGGGKQRAQEQGAREGTINRLAQEQKRCSTFGDSRRSREDATRKAGRSHCWFSSERWTAIKNSA